LLLALWSIYESANQDSTREKKVDLKVNIGTVTAGHKILNRFEVPEKIVMPDVVNRGECFLDTRGLWLLDTAYALVPLSNKPVNIRYILGILNSPILTYFFERNRFCIKGWIFSNENSLLKSVSFPNN
jgi:hypothetical protein